MGGQKLEGVDLEEDRVEQELPGRGPLLGLGPQTATDEVLL